MVTHTSDHQVCVRFQGVKAFVDEKRGHVELTFEAKEIPEDFRTIMKDLFNGDVSYTELALMKVYELSILQSLMDRMVR